MPDYLRKDIQNLDPELDFWKKTDCYLFAEEEIKGILYIKKDSLRFQTNTGLGRANIQRLQKLDDELFEKEIHQIEDHQEWEGIIDFNDII
jgi:hypothetical protein